MEFYRYLLVIWSLLRTQTVINASENIALGKTTNHSSTYKDYDSSKAVDGCTSQNLNSGCCTHTDEGHTEAWWQVDLQTQSAIDYVNIIYRDHNFLQRLAGYEIYVSDTQDWRSGNRCHKDTTPDLASLSTVQNVNCLGVARYLTIYNDRRVKAYSWYSDPAFLELCEVQVYGCPLGKYGNGNCNGFCTNCLNNICDTTSGCNGCAPGHYKVGGSCNQCPVNCAGDTCNTTNGACLDCHDGYYGSACIKCPDDCSTDTCNKTSGQCFVCDAGFYGSFCDQTCSSNCENNVCDRVSGQCLACNNGFYGSICTPCPDGCGSTTCDKTSGQCFQCGDGYHGVFCNQPCPANCKNGVCKINNGQCTDCVAGYHGIQCDKNCPPNCNSGLCNKTNGLCIGCEAEFHGSNCSLSCPDNCKDRICKQDNGQCIECVSGFHGNKCVDRCGYCQGGRCDKDTGNCMTSCIDGLTGDRCDVKVVVVNVPSDGEDFNPAALGIGIGFGVVIVVMAIVIIVLVRKLHSARQRNTTRSTTMTDISLPGIGQELRTETDDPYDVIGAKKEKEAK